jgi:AcrR family transcriptional regulator
MRMAATRRVGKQTSSTRDQLLDGVEQLMVDEGYAAVSYRKVAAAAGVTAGLVQYYFPALDDLFVATIRRATDRNLGRLAKALESRPDQPLRVLWEYSRDEAAAALMMEFMALGNHRKSILSEIADATNRVRQVQLDALVEHLNKHGPDADDPSPAAMLFLMTGLPKMIQLEEGFGITAAHAEVVAMVEQYLDSGVWGGEIRMRARPDPSPARRRRTPRPS